jgi:hypothetical protein
VDEANPGEPVPQAAELYVFLQVDTNVICFSVLYQGGGSVTIGLTQCYSD